MAFTYMLYNGFQCTGVKIIVLSDVFLFLVIKLCYSFKFHLVFKKHQTLLNVEHFMFNNFH